MLLLHWVKPTIATILAPKLLRRFLAVVVPATPPACWDPQISPLMLELRTTFLEAPAEAGPGSPLNMVPRAAGLQAILKAGVRKRDAISQSCDSPAPPPLPSYVISGHSFGLCEVVKDEMNK